MIILKIKIKKEKDKVKEENFIKKCVRKKMRDQNKQN